MKDDSTEAIDVDAERAASLSVALKLAEIGLQSRHAFDKKRRRAFIELVCHGFSLAQAARQVGMSAGVVHYHRRTDPDFAEAVALAVELGCDPVTERLQAIALHGDPGNMATVRAAETYLKGAHSAYRPPSPRLRLERLHPDGTRDRITAGSNGIPE